MLLCSSVKCFTTPSGILSSRVTVNIQSSDNMYCNSEEIFTDILSVCVGSVNISYVKSVYSALTLDDEVRTISSLICGFLRTVSYGRDFEQQLNFCVDARAAFSNLDTVIAQLVQVRRCYCTSGTV